MSLKYSIELRGPLFIWIFLLFLSWATLFSVKGRKINLEFQIIQLSHVLYTPSHSQLFLFLHHYRFTLSTPHLRHKQRNNVATQSRMENKKHNILTGDISISFSPSGVSLRGKRTIWNGRRYLIFNWYNWQGLSSTKRC